MREIKRLAGSEVLLQSGPYAHHSCIGKQTHHDGALVGSLFDGEERLAWNPSVGLCLLESLALTLAYNHVEAVVAQVASLTGTLYAVANDGNRLVLQNLTCFLKRELFAGHNFLDDAAKIHFCHSLVDLLLLKLYFLFCCVIRLIACKDTTKN